MTHSLGVCIPFVLVFRFHTLHRTSVVEIYGNSLTSSAGHFLYTAMCGAICMSLGFSLATFSYRGFQFRSPPSNCLRKLEYGEDGNDISLVKHIFRHASRFFLIFARGVSIVILVGAVAVIAFVVADDMVLIMISIHCTLMAGVELHASHRVVLITIPSIYIGFRTLLTVSYGYNNATILRKTGNLGDRGIAGVVIVFHCRRFPTFLFYLYTLS